MKFLNKAEISELLDSIDGDVLVFDRVRGHNRGEIRTSCSMEKLEFKQMISDAIDEEHQYGGEIELRIESRNVTLVGHHDGKYWLE